MKKSLSAVIKGVYKQVVILSVSVSDYSQNLNLLCHKHQLEIFCLGKSYSNISNKKGGLFTILKFSGQLTEQISVCHAWTRQNYIRENEGDL